MLLIRKRDPANRKVFIQNSLAKDHHVAVLEGLAYSADHEGNNRRITYFPRSQHRPTVITTGIIIPRITGIPKPRWNFRIAEWEAYKTDIDKTCQRIKPVHDNTKRFTQLILISAKKYIPRGFRKRHILCWSERSQELFGEYERTQDYVTAEKLLESFLQCRKERWKRLLKTWTLLTLVDMPAKQPKTLTLTLAPQTAFHLSAQTKLLNKQKGGENIHQIRVLRNRSGKSIN
ncbi:hypothetical protein ElyMa_006463500 [Elysia marginata]|uniref:Uncharacterized protein n=1 Tax=Elysia marginata TaxID=1093978 RepID=A0AAV4I0S1_9GAST|nr:hypothetical protein ElyMa_006463500 [Elysia marginata]